MLPDDLSAHIRSADLCALGIRHKYQSTRPGPYSMPAELESQPPGGLSATKIKD
jgi:hypothetical protein